MALSTEYIQDITSILERISTSLPGYVPRLSQKRMIAAVAEVLSRAEIAPDEDTPPAPNTGKSILVVQGGTGTGKSLAYLVGVVVAARAMKRSIVISSATVALQEQLVNRDVPFFVKNSGMPLTFTIAKGRTRYVCHHKLTGASGDGYPYGDGDLLMENAVLERKPLESEIKLYSQLLTSFNNGQWTGDRDELETKLPDEVWSQITTDRHGCLNRGCPSYSVCAQMKSRDKIHAVDIVIANHDLLLADIALGGGVILPNPANTFYVLDEGHHIAGKAVESFSHRHQVKSSQSIIEKLAASSRKIGIAFPELSSTTSQIDNDAEALVFSLSDAYAMLDSFDKSLFESNGNTYRFEGNALPEGSEGISSNVLGSTRTLIPALNKLVEKLADIKKSQEHSDIRLDKFIADTKFFCARVEVVADTWAALIAVNDPTDRTPPVAKWVNLEKKRSGQFDFTLCACPVSAADALAETFFSRANGVILTSATLMSMGNFDQLLNETGLSLLPDTSLFSLPSPYDYDKQGVISIPDIKASPKNAAAHTAAIVKEFPSIVEQTGNRGTLFLFSSRRQMMEVAEGIRPALRLMVLIQGETTKDALLKQHYSRIDSGKASIIFGLQSFAEGLDLPGDYCAHVVITKIPFAVPSDPVQKTLDDWLSGQGRSYFNEIAVPQACLRMIQAAGRLIRSETDTGQITILDERLIKTNYGRLIKNSLPPFRMLNA